MKAENFCYWLQGYAELMYGNQPTADQWKTIVKHLDLVFENVTKDRPDSIQDWYKREYKFPNSWPTTEPYKYYLDMANKTGDECVYGQNSMSPFPGLSC